jgi:hypothetical protein
MTRCITNFMFRLISDSHDYIPIMAVISQYCWSIPIELRGTGQVGAAEIGPQRAAATLASADAAWNPW